jgi:hypothetical protein
MYDATPTARGPAGAAAALLFFLAVPAAAQQRPLVTEDPETIGAGRILIEGGFDYSFDQFYPASGLKGDLLRLPLLGVSVGLSSIAELQIDAGVRNRLTIEERLAAPLAGDLTIDGDSTSDVEDIVIATKIRIASETTGRPAMGVRLATKLPNASNERGLGLDTTDFLATFLIGKTVESVRIVGNAGLGILGDPTDGSNQNDVLLFGASVARAIAEGVELVGEINGRLSTRSGTPPPGTESRATIRLGARLTRGAGRIDGAILLGTTTRDPDFGFAAGYTHVFNAFQVP